jgi:hypothetical protein
VTLDGEQPVWIPAENTTNRQAHKVPLPSESVAVLSRMICIGAKLCNNERYTLGHQPGNEGHVATDDQAWQQSAERRKKVHKRATTTRNERNDAQRLMLFGARALGMRREAISPDCGFR